MTPPPNLHAARATDRRGRNEKRGEEIEGRKSLHSPHHTMSESRAVVPPPIESEIEPPLEMEEKCELPPSTTRAAQATSERKRQQEERVERVESESRHHPDPETGSERVHP